MSYIIYIFFNLILYKQTNIYIEIVSVVICTSLSITIISYFTNSTKIYAVIAFIGGIIGAILSQVIKFNLDIQ